MKQVKKVFVTLLKQIDLGSALAIRLVKITGKSKEAVHPKHLINDRIWFARRIRKSDFILDLGCGNGFTLIRLKGKINKAVGTDVDQQSIKIANGEAQRQHATNIRFIVADANRKMPFKSNTFDKIVCSDVLEHLDKRNFALGEIHRVLKKKGLLFLVTDNPDTSWKKLQKSVDLFYYADRDHKYEYSRSEIIKLLKKVPFKIISVNTVTYDTPIKGLIDLAGGFSLSAYKKLREWKKKKVKEYANETTGFRIIAQKI